MDSEMVLRIYLTNIQIQISCICMNAVFIFVFYVLSHLCFQRRDKRTVLLYTVNGGWFSCDGRETMRLFFFFSWLWKCNDKKLLCNTDNSDGVLQVLYYTCSLRPVLSGNLKPKKGAFFNNRFLKLLRRETVIN